MVHLFDKFDEIDKKTYKTLFSLLPSSRKKKVLQREGLDKKIAIIEYFLLKKVLGFDNYPDFKYSKNGKPLLDGYHFSIAHCDNILCVATASNGVGVDIQKICTYDENVAKFVLNDKEFQLLSCADDKSRTLCKFFVQKEATIKCLGGAICDIKNVLNSDKFLYRFNEFKGYLICECIKK